MAVNWPYRDDRTKTMTAALGETGRTRGHDSFFITPSDGRGNIVQFLPTGTGRGTHTIAGTFEQFANERHILDADRPVLADCIISSTVPVTE